MVDLLGISSGLDFAKINDELNSQNQAVSFTGNEPIPCTNCLDSSVTIKPNGIELRFGRQKARFIAESTEELLAIYEAARRGDSFCYDRGSERVSWLEFEFFAAPNTMRFVSITDIKTNSDNCTLVVSLGQFLGHLGAVVGEPVYITKRETLR